MPTASASASPTVFARSVETAIHNVVAEAKDPMTVPQIARAARKRLGSKTKITDDQIVGVLSRSTDIECALAFRRLVNGQVKRRAEAVAAAVRFGDRTRAVLIEGNIGVGKTTLCARISAVWPDAVRVYREIVNSDFLELMYSAGAENAFAFQMYMLTQRQHASALDRATRSDPPPIRLHDRSLVGDVVFAVVNRELGNISTAQFLVYRSIVLGDILRADPATIASSTLRERCERDPAALFDEIARCPGYLDDPNLTVWYLDDAPENCKRRVETARKIAAEDGVPLSYYRAVASAYDRALVAIERVFLTGKVRRYRFPDFDPVIAALASS